MCGIAGFWRLSADKSEEWLNETASTMHRTLVHRGPDDKGIWSDPEIGVALGHRRLSIIDTSHAGHQPMVSSDGRFVITYNGEIYNFLELRLELEKMGHGFRGHSDTEVMLVSFQEWGVEGSLKRFNGMFAIALWDRRDRLLTLARDRLGEKPLYYGVKKGTLFFGSELKAIRAHPDFKPQIDRNALVSFLRFSYVPAPYSIYSGIKKLLPGHLLSLKSSVDLTESQPYWSLDTVMQNGTNNSFTGSEEEAAEELEVRLIKTVKSRMVSDVPLGAFLSGGIDSSAIVALMQTQSDRPVNTFSMGFHEQGFNEAAYAKRVAEHLGTNHTEIYLNSQEAMDVIPKLPEMYDEPFADSSQIPTHLISSIARKHVTVALSGDGGDELFAGYNRYIIAARLWRVAKYVPSGIKNRAAKLVAKMSTESAEFFYGKIESVLPKKMKVSQPAEKLQKIIQVLHAASTPQEIYKRIVSIIHTPEKFLVSGSELPTLLDDGNLWATRDDLVLTMVYLDLMTYHPDDILQKVDRASMHLSLETRVPFLDHDIIEFVMKLPIDFKLKKNQGKHLLRKVLYKYVPREIMERPKMGFSIPLGEWLREPLKDWADDFINADRLKREGYFDPIPIHKMWDEHLSGRANWGHQLWNMLMFQSWLESNRS